MLGVRIKSLMLKVGKFCVKVNGIKADDFAINTDPDCLAFPQYGYRRPKKEQITAEVKESGIEIISGKSA